MPRAYKTHKIQSSYIQELINQGVVSATELSKDLGVSLASVSKWSKGASCPPIYDKYLASKYGDISRLVHSAREKRLYQILGEMKRETSIASARETAMNIFDKVFG